MITDWTSVGREFFAGVDSEKISFEIASTSQAIGHLCADDDFVNTLSQTDAYPLVGRLSWV